MKKIISFSAALVIMLSGICATSCGKRTEENNNKENSSISDDISGDELSGAASLGQKVDVSGITGYYTAEYAESSAESAFGRPAACSYCKSVSHKACDHPCGRADRKP